MNLNNVHLAGHSRGGHEALTFCERNAVNPSFQIKSLTLFAPVWRSDSDVSIPFMLLAGTADTDQPFLLHQQAFTNHSHNFSRKYLVELYGGNHVFFNNQPEESDTSTQVGIMSKEAQLAHSANLVDWFIGSIDATDEQTRREMRDIISGRARDCALWPQEDIYFQSLSSDDVLIDQGDREVKSNKPHFISTVNDHPTNFSDAANMKLVAFTETFGFQYDLNDMDISQYRFFSYKAGRTLANSDRSPLQTVCLQDQRGRLIHTVIDTDAMLPAFYVLPCGDDSIADCEIFRTVTDLHIKLDEMENAKDFDFGHVKRLHIVNHHSGSIYMSDLRFSR